PVRLLAGRHHRDNSLLSEVAQLITNFLRHRPLRRVPRIAEDARFTMFSHAYGFGPDLLLAIVVVIALGLVLDRTTWGLKVKTLGELNWFAQYSGVSVKAMSIQVMTLTGVVAGLTGALIVMGINGGRFLQVFSPGFGYIAITVALLARLNPWASMVAALFYATLLAGGTGIQSAGVPYPMINVLQGLIISITATFIIGRNRWRRRASAEPVTFSKAESR
ncbi:MAG: ABC transporter permease subunit, partial [Propioniciclava sp.]